MNKIHLIAPNHQTSKIACSSFQRVLTTANLISWKNTIQPLFRLERSNYIEHFTEKNYACITSDFLSFAVKFFDFNSYETNIFANPATICMRNPDHLWSKSNEFFPSLQYMEDRNERLQNSNFATLLAHDELDRYGHRFVSSPSVFTVRSEFIDRLIDVWKEANELGHDLDESIREKAVWNKTLVMLAGEMKQKPFERGEVIPVREGETDWDEVRNACIVSVSDWKDEKAKEHFLRCLYFGHFFGDESGLMLNILDL